VRLEPTIRPLVLMPLAKLALPPRVPRSVMLPAAKAALTAISGAVEVDRLGSSGVSPKHPVNESPTASTTVRESFGWFHSMEPPWRQVKIVLPFTPARQPIRPDVNDPGDLS
jgi:hypothetical protein